MGLLDINSLLSSLQPSDADQQDARRMGLLAAGLAMMGARNGHVMQDFGQAGLLGLQSYNQALENKQKLAQQKMQTISSVVPLLQLAQRQQMMQDYMGDGGSSPQPVSTGVQPQAGVAPSTAAQFGPQMNPPASSISDINPPASGLAGPYTGFAGLPPAPTVVPPGTSPDNVNGYVPPDWRQEMPASLRRTVAMTMDPAAMAKAAEDFSKATLGRNGITYSATGRPLYQIMPDQSGIMYYNPDGTPGKFIPYGQETVAAAANRAGVIEGAKKSAEAAAEDPHTLVDVPDGFGGTMKLPRNLAMAKLGGQMPPPNSAPNSPFGPTTGTSAPLSDAAEAASKAPQPPSVGFGRTLPPQLLENQKSRGEDLSKTLTQFATEARGAAEANTTLADIQHQVKSFTPGALTNAGSKVAEILVGAGVPQDSPWVQWLSRGAVGAVQASNKDTLLLQTAMTKSLGSREAAQIFMKLVEANPSSGMTPDGMAKVLDYLQGVNNWKIQRYSDAVDWQNSPKNPGHSLEGFEPWFNNTKPPQSFVPHLAGDVQTPSDQAAQNRGYGIQLKNGIATPSGLGTRSVTGRIGNTPATAPQLTPMGASNKTVQMILRSNPTPAQIEALREKGYLQ